MMKIKSRYAAGAASAALLAFAIAYTSGWEGRRYYPYYDVGHVLTVCNGHTGPDIRVGHRYTKAECDALMRKDIVAHEQRMLACAPQLMSVPGKTYVAINDWAFNVGTGAACKSTLIRKLRAGDIKGACRELSRWVYVNGRVIRGLEVRRVTGDAGRISEQQMCLDGAEGK